MRGEDGEVLGMDVLDWKDFCAAGAPVFGDREIAMTLGVFDGFHLGHQRLIQKVVSQPRTYPVLFTFRRSPAELLPHRAFLGSLATTGQKLEECAGFGMKAAVLIDFSMDFSKLTAKEFLDIILDRMRLSKLILGENHRLGYRGEAGAREVQVLLNRRGIEVDIIPTLYCRGLRISSTRIRQTILEGDLALAEEMLGRPYALDLGFLKEGGFFQGAERKSGGEGFIYAVPVRGFPQILPPPGEYPVLYESSGEFFPARLVLDNGYMQWEQVREIPGTKIFFCHSKNTGDGDVVNKRKKAEHYKGLRS
ncbi:MAG: FAD synthetase family protein [Spirochaetales bacterium]|jgi:riboflavin kinase/FMN adenylyltransferase|nr:FAD synthetase family protein [Spirochaetales bacterium]